MPRPPELPSARAEAIKNEIAVARACLQQVLQSAYPRQAAENLPRALDRIQAEVDPVFRLGVPKVSK